MELKVDITRTDYLEFNKYVFFRSRIKRSYIIATIFVIIWVLLLNKNVSFNFLRILTQSIIMYSAWTVIILILNYLTLKRIKKMPDDNGGTLGEKTYNFLDEGFKEITENNETLTKWDGIKRMAESKNYIYLFVDKIAAYIIPKRYFVTEDEKIKFIDFINSKISN
jgi:hypothetical protein